MKYRVLASSVVIALVLSQAMPAIGAEVSQKAKQVHESALVLDTHLDTRPTSSARVGASWIGTIGMAINHRSTSPA